MEITRSYFIIPGPLLTHLTLSMWKLFFPLRVVPFFFFLFTTPDDHSHHLSICCIEIYLYKKKAGGELLVFETAVEQSYQSTSWRDLIIEKNILSPVGRPPTQRYRWYKKRANNLFSIVTCSKTDHSPFLSFFLFFFFDCVYKTDRRPSANDVVHCKSHAIKILFYNIQSSPNTYIYISGFISLGKKKKVLNK